MRKYYCLQCKHDWESRAAARRCPSCLRVSGVREIAEDPPRLSLLGFWWRSQTARAENAFTEGPNIPAGFGVAACLAAAFVYTAWQLVVGYLAGVWDYFALAPGSGPILIFMFEFAAVASFMLAAGVVMRPRSSSLSLDIRRVGMLKAGAIIGSLIWLAPLTVAGAVCAWYYPNLLEPTYWVWFALVAPVPLAITVYRNTGAEDLLTEETIQSAGGFRVWLAFALLCIPALGPVIGLPIENTTIRFLELLSVYG